MVASDVYGLPLPLEEDWSTLKKTAATFLFLDSLIAGLEKLQMKAALNYVGSIEKVTLISLLDLLKKRYLDNFERFECDLKNPAQSSSLALLITDIRNEMVLLGRNDPALFEKIAGYVSDLYVPKLEEFISHDSVKLSEVLKSAFTAEQVAGQNSTCDLSDIDGHILNRVGIMNIKAADYIEDVLLYLSPSMPEAVLLLFQYIHIVENK